MSETTRVTPRERLALALLAALFAVAVEGAAAAEPAAASEPLRVVLPERTPTVGDQVELVLELTVPADCRLDGAPRFPTWSAGAAGGPATWGEVEVLAAAVTGAAPTWRQQVTLAAFRPGDLALPPVAITLPCAGGSRELRTPGSLVLSVQSLLPAEGELPPPRPPAPPRALPLPAAFWWALAALLALLVGAVWLLLRQRRRRATAPLATEPPLPALAPLAELEATLARLGDELGSLPAAGEIPRAVRERLHVGLSAAVRRYLERALATPATKSSTTEIQRALFGRQLPASVVRPLVRLLRDCDGVKFARAAATVAEIRSRLTQADELVHAVHAALHLDPAVVPPPVPPAARDAA
jgi:hypothetical protein